MQKKHPIHDLVAPKIEEMGFEVVRIMTTGSERQTVQIMIERQDRKNLVVDDFNLYVRKGEFITFLDSDDELQYDFLSTMLYIQKIQNADIVWAGVKITFPSKYKTEPVFISHSEYYLTEDGRFKLSNPQLANARSPIVTTVFGIVIPVNLIQLLKIPSGMAVIPTGIVAVTSFEHLVNTSAS